VHNLYCSPTKPEGTKLERYYIWGYANRRGWIPLYWSNYHWHQPRDTVTMSRKKVQCTATVTLCVTVCRREQLQVDVHHVLCRGLMLPRIFVFPAPTQCPMSQGAVPGVVRDLRLSRQRVSRSPSPGISNCCSLLGYPVAPCRVFIGS
jgi:hypothetical protein